MSKFTFCAPCLMGVESIASGEFTRLGFENVRNEDGRVYFDGDERTLARANLNSRYTERILIRLASFSATDFDTLYDGVRAVDWENYIAPAAQFPVRGHSVRSKLSSVPACQSIVKKAIADRLMAKRHVSWLDESGVRIQVQFSLLRDRAEIYLDTSGPSLHKRGWRPEGGTAPLRETLAAAMVDLSRFRGDMTFYDPFCGSGTLAIEAATKALRMAPGVLRRFDAIEFPFVPKSVWRDAYDEAKNLPQQSPATVFASDIDPKMVALARANARRAGVEDFIHFSVADAAARDYSASRGVIVTNPPYGERLGDVEQAREIYRSFGRALNPLGERSLYLITPDDSFERCFGARAARKRWLYNGMIKCSLYMYFPQRPRKQGAD